MKGNKMKTNTILPNGATIKRHLVTDNGGVILAWRDHSVHQYITWYYNGTDFNTTCWGHYFDNYDQANKDFLTRAKTLIK